jgi:hypothetical protein
MRGLRRFLFVLSLAIVPVTATAQSGASIAGVVKDASGAVLPGVTVEAASPALIEKIRTGVTDGNGAYRITELFPGTYSVTFALTGFSTVKRENLELTGSFVATINVELKVGSVAETITVTGETPIVDVQNTTHQTVMSSAVVDALPTGRNMFNVGVLIPGITLTTGGLANQDVGGALGPNTLALGIHGGHTEDQRMTMNGISLSTMIGGGWGGGTIPNAAGVSETLFDTSAVDASLATGGVRINFIAKDGGNKFSGTAFGEFANASMQGNNYTDRLKTLGLTTPGNIVKNYDFNPGFGGPIMKDQLWFYLSGRRQVANTLVPGQFYNKNANDPNQWAYVADTSRPAELHRAWQDYNARITWQASPKNKFGFLYNIQSNCFCPFGIGGLTAPEAGNDQRFPLQRPIEVDWTSPISSKVLLEATAIHRIERWGAYDLGGSNAVAPGMISVTDNGPGAFRPGMTYRSAQTYSNNINTTFHYALKVSYITGAHAFKFGLNDAWGSSDPLTYSRNQVSYTFQTPVGAAPTPFSITESATPYTESVRVDHDFGLFAQDRWTRGRATIALGLRFDHVASSYPQQGLGPTPLTPDRNVVFPEAPQVSWSDITPKTGLAYDLFGNGKTAVKVSLNKYLRGFGTTLAIIPDPNPTSAAVGFGNATRSWTDANHNYIPDCDLSNRTPGANGECGALSDPNFGSNNVQGLLNQLKFDPNLQTGFGKRPYNWEFSTGVQQQLTPRVSMDVGFFRRWYGNFQVVDNLALSPADFNYFNYTVPMDPRLPGGGGNTVTGFASIKPTVGGFGFPTPGTGYAANQNVIKLSDDIGNQIEHWNGVDVNFNARLSNGFFAQGGFSTGRTSTNNCDIVAKLPETLFEGQNFFSPYFLTNMPASFCKQDGVFITQVKALASYTIPKADVQLSATYQNLPGVPITAAANLNGLVPVAGLQFIFPSFHIVQPGTLYGERLSQVDLRVSKIFRFAGKRANFIFDVYNLFNADTITGQDNTYTPVPGGQAIWQVPNLILQARFIKVGMSFDF